MPLCYYFRYYFRFSFFFTAMPPYADFAEALRFFADYILRRQLPICHFLLTPMLIR